jgi:predicted O-methyltransferase YrrM
VNLQSYITFLNDLGFRDPSPDVMRAYSNVPGFSSPYIMSLLNIAVRHLEGDEIYLEVGTYRGRTLIGATIGTGKFGVGIDDFSEFCDDPDVREAEIAQRIEDFKLSENVHFFRKRHDQSHPYQKVGVYFYDGCHNTTPGFEAMEYMVPYLADQAVIVVDDFSGEGVWESVRLFTRKHKKQARVLLAMHTNDFPNPHINWWNGVMVLGWNKEGKFR